MKEKVFFKKNPVYLNPINFRAPYIFAQTIFAPLIFAHPSKTPIRAPINFRAPRNFRDTLEVLFDEKYR